MGKLIASTQATLDGVVDPVGEWVQPDGDHGDYSFERQARSSGLVLGRKTYEGLAGYWPSQSGKWADMINPMPKYVGSSTLSGELEWNATLLEGREPVKGPSHRRTPPLLIQAAAAGRVCMGLETYGYWQNTF
jgi:dihydrofolate reductase